ncbi:carboxylating nicotinate-nucleotide diphosphorylase [Clostridium guangxiense]|uniref:carboxylating nicotinate-nucleotide diphosphorylase n=1 Tax=Clostridium guangxiense TaxID=1662055 RepID=UPI001E33D2CF|nr:carboxylating nicotinate-nucleotide diphosphorylase [Clostridium guangxiense]MCD2346515.1 carboxylating nicotinate-nucleotide diphosphorylase [Clostridium guangxiense]
MNWSLYDNFIKNALDEDGAYNDITVNSIIPPNSKSVVDIISKDNGIIAGIELFKRVFFILGNAEATFRIKDGDRVKNGEIIGYIKGSTCTILSGERTALNLLQKLSGIATTTNELCTVIKDTGVKIVDTRKTTPGMRLMEKYAVKVGGGFNHRFGLSDGILIKDNHISAAGSITKAIELTRKNAPFVRKIEVETESISQVKEALKAGADIIMLDNMNTEEIKKSVEIINKKAIIEVSGNINFETIKTKALKGVNYISSGMITHSSKNLDLSMKNLRNLN